MLVVVSGKFQFDEEKSAAAISYLASKRIQGLSKGKICKLIFLADKCHLVRYGRPITGDKICAMKDGPVPSGILNMLNRFLADPADPAVAILSKSVSVDRAYIHPHFQSDDFRLRDFLSDTDVEALDATIARFGDKTFSELRAITHEMPAYYKAWNDNRPHDSPAMDFEDFFEEDDDAIEAARQEMLDNLNIRKALTSIASV